MITIEEKQDLPIRDEDGDVVAAIVWDVSDKRWSFRANEKGCYFMLDDLLQITEKIRDLNKE